MCSRGRIQGVPNELNDEWVEKDEKVQSTISLTVSGSQNVHISKCNTAKDMWDELQKVHERANFKQVVSHEETVPVQVETRAGYAVH